MKFVADLCRCCSVRSVTLYLEDMDGVAFTKGSELDDDHKEIHFSTRHIENNKQRCKDEVLGVIVHEMVHCFQYNAKGSCPGGLIEGIAGTFCFLLSSDFGSFALLPGTPFFAFVIAFVLELQLTGT